MRVIMEIPSQQFSFIKDWDIDVDSDVVNIGFTEPCTGTILLVAEVFEDDEDALCVLGVPDGESTGKVAMWPYFEKFHELWEKMIEEKQKYLKEV